MSNDPFSSFVKFIELDKLVEVTIQECKKFEQNLLAADHLALEQQQIVEQMRSDISLLRKKLAKQELESKSLELSQKSLIQKLELVTSSKEYVAFDTEIKDLHVRRMQLEEHALETMQDLENKENELNKMELDYEKENVQRAKLRTSIEVALSSCHERMLHLSKEREQECQRSPIAYVEKYEKMKEKVSNPAVSVVRGNCGGCFTEIIQSDMAQLKRHRLIHCRACYRLLYMQ